MASNRPLVRRRQESSRNFQVCRLTSFVVDFDLTAGAVSWKHWRCGRETHVEKPIPQIGDFELGCDVCSPEECLEER